MMSLSELQLVAAQLYERYPMVLLGVFSVAWVAAGVAIFLYLFSPAGAESQMVRGASGVGLVAVENRGSQNPLPPAAFFESAKRQIVVTGVGAYRTFDQNKELLKQLLEKGIHVYVLMLVPDSAAARELSAIENKNIPLDIEQTLTVIKSEPLTAKPGFHIRFFDAMPPFTAVMIDGDIDPTGAAPLDAEATIRVQPRAAFGSQHQGVVMTFKQTQKAPGAFKNFSSDIRRQWKAAKLRPDLVQ